MRVFLVGALPTLFQIATAYPVDGPISTSLQWLPCDLDFGYLESLVAVNLSCATLEVPLDYTNPHSEALSLSLVKVNSTKAPFKGSVLFNPGGPGGSGIEDVAITGGLYNTILGGHYDLIGFDPRGTGKTIPFACDAWSVNNTPSTTRRDVLPEKDLVQLAYGPEWDAAGYLADQCYKKQNKTGSFLSTAFVARDMVEIIDALNEDGMLRYWGTSYGTLLGQTFAAMFPERVDRLFLDSVVQADDYMAGYWLTPLTATDSVFLAFLDSCIESGPSYCGVANILGPQTTAADLLTLSYNMFDYLLESNLTLGKNVPTVSWNKGNPKPEVYDYLKRSLFVLLYSPSSWPLLSTLLQPLLALDFSSFTTDLPAPPPPVSMWSEGPDAFWGVACSDTAFRAEAPEEIFWLIEQQHEVGSFADALATQIWPCYRWKMHAAERYCGKFEAKTNHPILFSGNIADPVTPLSSAFNASSGFEGSVVLTHGGYGHGSYSQPSLCTARVIREYFINGTLPAVGTRCEPDFPAFQIPDFTSVINGTYFKDLDKRSEAVEYSDDDKEVLLALVGLHEYNRGKHHNHPLMLA